MVRCHEISQRMPMQMHVPASNTSRAYAEVPSFVTAVSQADSTAVGFAVSVCIKSTPQHDKRTALRSRKYQNLLGANAPKVLVSNSGFIEIDCRCFTSPKISHWQAMS